MTAAIIVLGLLLSALSGLAAATKPLYALAGLGAAVAAIGAKKLGLWRALYATTLILLLCATTWLPALPAISYYPRYAAAAALGCATYFNRSGPIRLTKSMPGPARTLTTGLFIATATGAISTLWSVDPLLTLQQTVALFILATTVYALLSRRWTDPSLIPGDIAIAYWTLTVFFAAGLATHFAGITGTQSAAGFNGYELVQVRYQGLATNPNMLGLLIVPTIPLGWFMYQQTRQSRYLAAMTPAVMSMLLSQSRTTMLSLVAAGAVLLTAGVGSPPVWLLAYGLCLAVPFLAAAVRKRVEPSPVDLGAVRRFGWGLMPSTIAAMIMLRSDRLLLPALSDYGQLGVYGVVATITELISMPVVAYVDSHVPVWRRAHLAGELRTWRVMGVAAGYAAVAVVVATITIRWLVVPVFGREYEPATGLVLPLAAAAALYGVSRVGVGLLTAAGRSRSVVTVDVAAMVVAVVGYVVLIPSSGALGAALGSVGGYGVAALVAAVAVSRPARPLRHR